MGGCSIEETASTVDGGQHSDLKIRRQPSEINTK